MAKRKIVKVGDSVLREKAKTVTVFDNKLSQLIDDMVDTMFASNGVGLAAPQVGMLKKVAVVSIDGEEIYELINPVVLESSGEQIGMEGCLSVEEKTGYVKRPYQMKVQSQTRDGESVIFDVDDFLCVAFCHEIDHLDGILFIDKIIPDYKED